jgi:16S rRNA (guanine(527)-N(7))-methyltransferase RsmG
MQTKTIPLLISAFEQNGLKITREEISLFSNYYLLTSKWGHKINITANLSPEKFIQENILDPALAFNAFTSQHQVQNSKIADTGCGGGYAGLVWAILSRFSFDLTLIDSDRKKINFCKQFIRENNLPKCQAKQSRVEDFINNNKDIDFDIIISRATWGCEEFSSINSPLLKRPGFLCYFQGSQNAPISHRFKSTTLSYKILPTETKRSLIVYSL